VSAASDAQPKIVLVRPQLGENIGKAARAMLNFGLTDLALVRPRDGWPNPAAVPASAGADDLLDKAQVFETLADAVADCGFVLATTVRKRGITKPVATPAEAAEQINQFDGRAALVFGPERSGLDAEEVTLARTIVTVPVNPDFGSLNLAQAVILLAYEWSKTRELAMPTRVESEPVAPQAELEGLIAHVDEALEPTGYFFPPDRTPSTKRAVRSLLTKPGWTSAEIRAMRGIISALEKKQR
jgi:tRNA/rRNA methyltransferase